jgi:hypothetical protein
MDLADLININADNSDLVKYLFIFFIIYIFILKSKVIFSYRQILVISISILLTGYYIKNDIKNNFNSYKKIKIITDELNIDKFKYIKTDIKILNILYKLIYLRSLNPYCYKKSLQYLERFLKKYYKIKSNDIIYPKKYIYTSLITNKKKVLNNLQSCIINYPSKKKIYIESSDIYFYKKDILLEISNLDKTINDYIINAKEIINNEWDNNNTNIYSNEIDNLYPEPNNIKTKYFNYHHSIY